MSGSAVDEATAALAAAVDRLLALDCGVVSAEKLVHLLEVLETQRRRLQAVEVPVLAALAAQVSPGQLGATSMPDLIGGRTHVTPGEARARAQRAIDLAPRRQLSGEVLPPIQPRTGSALAAGEISGEHVDVITRYLGRIPAEVAARRVTDDNSPEPVLVFEIAEAFLVDAARHEDPATLRRSGELLLARLNPDGVEPREEEIARRRAFGLRQRADGTITPWGTLTGENGAVWKAVLSALAAPQPAADGEPDPRTPGQRQHDALLEAGLRLLRAGTLPDSGGVTASVLVHLSSTDLATATDAAGAPCGSESESELAAELLATLDFDPELIYESDLLDGPAPLDGAEPLEHCCRDTEPASGSHGAEPARGVALTASGELFSLATLERLAGDGEITTVVIGPTGGVLDYGRTRRFATPGLRRAMAVRDGGCSFPGCTRPPAWCEAHHIRAWIEGGRTSLDNLCLLCAYHHRTFERSGWVVEIRDGVPQWTPPARVDPLRRPRRNTAHHLSDIRFAPTNAGVVR